jgi:O-antigen biosynthesis protein WbqP
MYKYFFKRVIDVVISISLLVILFPVLIIVALLIFFQDFGPVFFIQKRIGKGGREFSFFKFRSMPVYSPNVESKETQKIKITPFGKIIRRTNLDEIPQLLNIIKGDMSLIGPRPPIVMQKTLVELRRKNGALSLRPGLTGWAQVNSYDFMPEDEKAKFDGEYFQKLSFLFDCKILIKTFGYLTKTPPTY